MIIKKRKMTILIKMRSIRIKQIRIMIKMKNNIIIMERMMRMKIKMMEPHIIKKLMDKETLIL